MTQDRDRKSFLLTKGMKSGMKARKAEALAKLKAEALAKLKHDDPVRYDYEAKRSWAWKQVERLAGKAKAEAVRLRALEQFIDRTDPRTDALAQTGPLTLNIAIVNGGDGHPRRDARDGSATNGGAVRFRHRQGDES